MVVRDEADILAANLEHHLAAGVDRAVVFDNGSTDGTADLLDAYARAGVVEVVRDDAPGFRLDDAADKLVRQAAARLRPDWILCPDADEFVMAPPSSGRGDLRDALDAHHADRVLTCARDNVVGSLQALADQDWRKALGYLCTRDIGPPPGHADPDVPLPLPYFCLRLPPKVIFRTQGLRAVGPGRHSVLLAGDPAPAKTAIRMRHFPIRSTAEFLRSVRRFTAIIAPPAPGRPRVSGKYHRWGAMLAQPDGAARILAEALPDAAALAAGLADGSFVPVGDPIDWGALNRRAATRGAGAPGTASLQCCDH